MKLVSFMAKGRPSYGVVSDDTVIDVGRTLGNRFATVREIIAADAFDLVRAEADKSTARIPLNAITYLPPIPSPDKIICIGVNYKAHAAEAGRPPPEFPSLFLRLNSTLVPHNGALIRPKLSGDFDYEVELALIIGRPGRHISREAAMSHIAGYSCFNDGSIRNYQFKHSLAVGKNFAGTGGFGPWMVTADEITDPGNLTVLTRINGKELQHSNTSDFIFDIPYIISYCSDFAPLAPGDVIITGTPEGVGFARKPPVWLKPGDVCECEISGIGILSNTVEAEA